MIRALVRLLMTLIILLALAVGGIWFFMTQTDFGKTATVAIMNSAGVAEHIENAVVDNKKAIADHLGVSVDEVDAMVQDLDIGSWQAVDVPEGVETSREVGLEYEGTPVKATFYDDPSYVTLDAGGQNVTFRIPDSAQGFAEEYLELLQ
jgi:type II secretory pathway pseudopilin PulG